MQELFNYLFEKAVSAKNALKFEESFKPDVGEMKVDIVENDIVVNTTGWDKNIIVENSFDILTTLLSTADVTKKIDTLKLGDQGIVNNAFVFPVVTDQTLRNETHQHVGTEQIQIDKLAKTIQFTFRVPEAEGNGLGAVIYNEAGLCASDGTMFSRKVFSEMVKTEDQSLIVYWKLKWN